MKQAWLWENYLIRVLAFGLLSIVLFLQEASAQITMISGPAGANCSIVNDLLELSPTKELRDETDTYFSAMLESFLSGINQYIYMMDDPKLTIKLNEDPYPDSETRLHWFYAKCAQNPEHPTFVYAWNLFTMIADYQVQNGIMVPIE